MNIREDIKAYIDGELSEARAAEVRQAIASDPSLQKEYEAMSSLTESLRGMARVPTVVGVEKVLRAPQRGMKPWTTAVVGAAAVVALAMVFFPDLGRVQNPETTSASMTAATAPAEMTSRGEVGGNFVDDKWSAEGRSQDENTVANAKPIPAEVPLLRRDAGANGRSVAPTQAPAPIVTLPDDRLVIKNASFNIEVDDVQGSMDKATHMTRAAGGFIESSNKSEVEGKSHGYMTIRVPEKNFESAVTQLRSYGEVKSEGVQGDDVTTQVADIDARIKTLKSEEESYREILRQARRIGDILDIKERISQVRQEIESLTAQQATLRKLSALSTINVEFVEAKKATDEPKPDDWFEETKVSATLMLKGIGKFFAQIGVYLFTLAPIWIPVAALAYWLRKRSLTP